MNRLVEKERLVHRGHIAIAGLYYLGRDEAWARQDILNRYALGTRVFRHQGALLVVFAESARVPVAECPGVPLVRQTGLLTSLPLDDPQERLQGLGLGLSLAQGGEIKLSDLRDADEEDPSSWLYFEKYSFEVGRSLHRPLPPPEMMVEEGTKDVRDALDGVIADCHPEAKETLLALNRATQGRSAASRSAGSGLGGALLRVGYGAMTGVLGRVARLSRSGSQRLSQGPGGTALAVRRDPSPVPGFFRRMTSRFKSLLWKSSLGSWLGRHHAKYLSDLFNLLESGSYEEALRRAIPTGGKGDGSGFKEPMLLPFAGRDQLTLGGRTEAGPTLGLGEGLYAQLRAAYRQAFRDLDRQKRFHEAAFVLSELLQENDEAVTYLESNGLVQQAAKLAEARELAPGLIVRLWFRAGDRQRALALARRDGVFEDALTRLKGFPDDAKAFRLLWAETLAEAGNYAGAVEVAKALDEATALCARWLELAIQQGGVAGAHALVLKCRLQPKEFGSIRNYAAELLRRRDLFDGVALQEMGRRLVSSTGRNRAEATLARCLVRALLRDRALGLNGVEKQLLSELALMSGDGALVADLPTIPALKSLPRLINRDERIKLTLSGADAGVTTVHDAVSLGGGRYLVAKGDGGAYLYNRHQKLVHHFDVPARQFVVSDQRSRVLALARRGELYSVSQIDVNRRVARRWNDLAIDEFAKTFDGDRWYVAIGSFVHALDVMGSSQRSLWRSGDTQSNILSIGRAKGRLLFTTGSSECWEHDVDPYRLRRRAPSQGFPVLGAAAYDVWLGRDEAAIEDVALVPEDEVEYPDDVDDEEHEPDDVDDDEFEETEDSDKDEDDEDQNASTSEAGEAFDSDEVMVGDRDATHFSLGIFGEVGRAVIFGRADRVTNPKIEDANAHWIVASYVTRPGTTTVLLVDRLDLKACIEIELQETNHVSARLGPEDLIVADNRGRVLGFELGAGTQLISHRV